MNIDTSYKQSKRILITSGSGFIGSHVAETFLQGGNYVILVDDLHEENCDRRFQYYNLSILKSSYPPHLLTVYHGDLAQENFIKMIFDKERPTHVCYFDELCLHNCNVFANILELSQSYEVQNFVYTSSDDNSHDSFAEKFSTLHGLNCIGLRIGEVYGPRGEHQLIMKYIDHILRGVPILLDDNGASPRELTYISDLVNGIRSSIDRRAGFEIFHFGGGSFLSLKELIDLVDQVIHNKTIIGNSAEHSETVTHANSRRRLPNYHPQVSLQEGLSRTIDWYKFFYSVIYPGGHIGHQILTAPDPLPTSSHSPTPPSCSSEKKIPTKNDAQIKKLTTNQKRIRTLSKFQCVPFSVKIPSQCSSPAFHHFQADYLYLSSAKNTVVSSSRLLPKDSTNARIIPATA